MILQNWKKAITNYYSVDGKMYSMPFNSSTPVLIYNKDAFAKAGLDPEKAPENVCGITRSSEKVND